MAAPFKDLVLDTNAFVNGVAMAGIAERYWTVEEVLAEVRDARARAVLDTLPFKLETRIPSDTSIAAVRAFAAKTGDLTKLSSVDVLVLALAYQLEREANGARFIRTEPPRLETQHGLIHARTTPECRFYHTAGGCREGDKCKFRHEGPPGPIAEGAGEAAAAAADGADAHAAASVGAAALNSTVVVASVGLAAAPAAAGAPAAAAAPAASAPAAAVSAPAPSGSVRQPGLSFAAMARKNVAVTAPAATAAVVAPIAAVAAVAAAPATAAVAASVAAAAPAAVSARSAAPAAPAAAKATTPASSAPAPATAAASTAPAGAATAVDDDDGWETVPAAAASSSFSSRRDKKKGPASGPRGGKPAAVAAAAAVAGSAPLRGADFFTAAPDLTAVDAAAAAAADHDAGAAAAGGAASAAAAGVPVPAFDAPVVSDDLDEDAGEWILPSAPAHRHARGAADAAGAAATGGAGVAGGDGASTVGGGAVGGDGSSYADGASLVSAATSYPFGYERIATSRGVGDEAKDLPADRIMVGCLTGDFAMQNVLLQMGLNLASGTGVLIRSLKQWVLKCDACFTLTPDMSKLFCPRCGNATLARLGVTIAADGTPRYHYKANRTVSTRGTQVALPAPRGGREGDLLLREDQLLTGYWAQKARSKVTTTSMFAERAPGAADDPTLGLTRTTRAAAAGGIVVGLGRKNPNEAHRRKR